MTVAVHSVLQLPFPARFGNANFALTMKIYTVASAAATREALKKLGDSLA
jgi:hypothetical protein